MVDHLNFARRQYRAYAGMPPRESRPEVKEPSEPGNLILKATTAGRKAKSD